MCVCVYSSIDSMDDYICIMLKIGRRTQRNPRNILNVLPVKLRVKMIKFCTVFE